ncbi:hypothetical protein C0991_010103, partial [Blastosporella zonata]
GFFGIEERQVRFGVKARKAIAGELPDWDNDEEEPIEDAVNGEFFLRKNLLIGVGDSVSSKTLARVLHHIVDDLLSPNLRKTICACALILNMLEITPLMVKITESITSRLDAHLQCRTVKSNLLAAQKS